VLNGTNGYVGYNSSGSNNSVLVNGSSSIWSNAGNVHVGHGSAGNTLTIDGGGVVYNDNQVIWA